MDKLPFVRLVRLSPSTLHNWSKQSCSGSQSQSHLNEEKDIYRKPSNLEELLKQPAAPENNGLDETLTSYTDDQTSIKIEDFECVASEYLSTEEDDDYADFQINPNLESVKCENIEEESQESGPKLQAGKGGGYIGPYICRLCHEIFNASQNLRRHIINEHLPPGPKRKNLQFQCIKCDKIFTKCTTLNSHYILHWDPKDRPYHCPNLNCGRSFATPKELRVHSVLHSTARPYKCKICGQAYKYKGCLAQHKSFHKCKICQAEFCSDYKFDQHMKDHERKEKDKFIKKFTCQICGETMKALRKVTHMKTHFKDYIQYKCIFCSKQFECRSGIDLHLRSHTGEMPYKCKICNKRFTQISNLKTHGKVHQIPKDKIQCPKCFVKVKDKPTLVIHELMCGKLEDFATMLFKDGLSDKMSKEPKYKCNECSKTFIRREYLRDHVMRFHLNLKAYECSYCDKKFIQRTELQVHHRMHINEKPYKCDVCGKEFRQSTHLKSHMISHSEDRPLKCPQCPKAFKTTATLRSHILLHTKELPYPCPQCKKAFPRSEVLKRHVNVHHLGIKRFECPEKDCVKRFFSRHEVKLHALSHSDERPFPCVICNVAFKVNGKLLEHCKSKNHIKLAKIKSLKKN